MSQFCYLCAVSKWQCLGNGYFGANHSRRIECVTILSSVAGSSESQQFVSALQGGCGTLCAMSCLSFGRYRCYPVLMEMVKWTAAETSYKTWCAQVKRASVPCASAATFEKLQEGSWNKI
eukprot:2905832-Amphidinium_carterae.2